MLNKFDDFILDRILSPILTFLCRIADWEEIPVILEIQMVGFLLIVTDAFSVAWYDKSYLLSALMVGFWSYVYERDRRTILSMGNSNDSDRSNRMRYNPLLASLRYIFYAVIICEFIFSILFGMSFFKCGIIIYTTAWCLLAANILPPAQRLDEVWAQ